MVKEIDAIVEAIRRLKEMEKDTEVWCVVGYGMVCVRKGAKIEDYVFTTPV